MTRKITPTEIERFTIDAILHCEQGGAAAIHLAWSIWSNPTLCRAFYRTLAEHDRCGTSEGEVNNVCMLRAAHDGECGWARAIDVPGIEVSQ